MPEYRFSLTRMFPHNDKIFDFVLIREYEGQRKPVVWHILRSITKHTELPINMLLTVRIQYHSTKSEE